MSRLLVVHPGASWSTHDVHTGLTDAIRALGHDVIVFPLDHRIDHAAGWYNYLWQQTVNAGREAEKPNAADILFTASETIISRALLHDVDGVLIISAMFVPKVILAMCQRASVPVGVVFTESPYDDARQVEWARFADVVWTNERSSVDTFRDTMGRAYYLPAAYHPGRHTHLPQPGDEDISAHDVVMIGTGWPERVELLSRIDWTGIDLGLYGLWEAVTPDHVLAPFVKAGIQPNEITAALYRRAKIGLNLYRTSIGFEGKEHIDHAESLNPRAYEMAACGCFQIASYRAEVADVFGMQAGITCVGAIYPHDEPADIEARIRDCLESDGPRQMYARAARELVARHTFAERAAQLMRQFEPVLAERAAPVEVYA